jgi:methionine-R-sulfoxide reductase
MKKSVYTAILVLSVVLLTACEGVTQTKNAATAGDPVAGKVFARDTTGIATWTDSQWKTTLTPAQYDVLREKGTDMPFAGKFYKHKEKGTYVCAGCGTELFTSSMKFDSDCGWPSFDKEIAGGKVKQVRDNTHGMERIEILCAKCGSHLGHIFDDGPTVTGLRYCVNSTSIDFKKK